LTYMLHDCDPAVLLTHDPAREALSGFRPTIPVLNMDRDWTQWDGEIERNPEWVGIRPSAGNLAYIIYTSGSTGVPKGAMNEHGALVNRLVGMQRVYNLGPDDAVLQKTPFSFDVSVWEFFWPLLFGARLVMAAPHGHKDPSYLARIIRQEKITTVHFVPSMLRAFLEHSAASECRSLVRVLCGGESLSEAQASRFYERLPGTDLYNLYGPAEAAIDVTAWNCRDGACGVGIPIGRPLVNTCIYILDSRGLPAPIGVAGELYIAGVQVGRGYLNRAQLTAERFQPSPFSQRVGERIYKTGDLGRWLPEGKIEFLGRNDFQVKIRGFRVELGEIEASLSSHHQVREAVVVAREDDQAGKQLVAYYTGENLGAETLRAYLSSMLPDYMTPSSYVHLESLPLNPNGKLDRRALPAPERDSYVMRRHEPPAGETETQLARIWTDVLKVDRVGRRDNFFELGGHSLLATMLIVRIKQEMAVDVNLVNVFEFPELASLAECIVAAQLAEFDPGELAQIAALLDVS
jgi:amino acid adenylation domain-containing protein